MKWLVYLIVLIITGIVFAMLGLLNSGSVSLNYIFGTQTMPLVVVMLLSFFAGALLTLIVFGFKALFWRRRAKSLQAAMQREKQAAEKAAVEKSFQADNIAEV